ncbi:MAG: hypothetical protein IPN34_07880 [Planctomycetes bacterium]|nr:hypothetical protein [Planctomycetota bacterium]
MGFFMGELLLATAWVFLGDPSRGEVRVWSGSSASAPRVLEGLVELRALGADRERGVWVAHGAHGREIVRAELVPALLAPRVARVQRLALASGVRALAAGSGPSCVALVESGALVLVRASARGLELGAEEAWPPLHAVAADARGALLLSDVDGGLYRAESSDLRFASAVRVAAPGVPIEAIAWCSARSAWLAVESGAGHLRCLAPDGSERLRLALPFPAIAAAGSSSRLWVASASENFVASIDLAAGIPRWRAEEVPPGDLGHVFARGSRLVAVGSTRWSWRRRGAWLAGAGGPGLLAVERPR